MTTAAVVADRLATADDVQQALLLGERLGLHTGRLLGVFRAIISHAADALIRGGAATTDSTLAAVARQLADTTARTDDPTERPSVVARRIGVATPTVLNWIRVGVVGRDGSRVHLAAVRIGNRYAIHPRDLKAFLFATNATRTAAPAELSR